MPSADSCPPTAFANQPGVAHSSDLEHAHDRTNEGGWLADGPAVGQVRARAARAVLRKGSMHEVFFSVKRAFHASLRVTRRALAALGLTAARFELLLVLYEDEEEGTPQRSLVLNLGVSASVVSRMLKALEGLGLVSRTTSLSDRRCRWVTLTAKGLSRVRLLEWRCMRSGQAALAVDCALAGKRVHVPGACEAATESALAMLLGMRREWGDTARRYRPWWPDAASRW